MGGESEQDQNGPPISAFWSWGHQPRLNRELIVPVDIRFVTYIVSGVKAVPLLTMVLALLLLRLGFPLLPDGALGGLFDFAYLLPPYAMLVIVLGGGLLIWQVTAAAKHNRTWFIVAAMILTAMDCWFSIGMLASGDEINWLVGLAILTGTTQVFVLIGAISAELEQPEEVPLAS